MGKEVSMGTLRMLCLSRTPAPLLTFNILA